LIKAPGLVARLNWQECGFNNTIKAVFDHIIDPWSFTQWGGKKGLLMIAQNEIVVT
jgi:hypothetical protein